ncbi:hypothetical protein EJ06DRAFT_580581 [Trichodelitschia bisporula]|uniref:Dol-P-Man:Man(5)GlcNAc(2)-PP-Dol alpha-1,3-mannosyltransferase n=1 Tax=Trichodelitschia bisporula TaxID=703511 RepID=A0A6G1I1W4_9PEZI|nr:hypothetical protein EJ06DRAFT_580581 [Trichodelitschia bisporula]
MSTKLSPTLKALIIASHARPNPVPVPTAIATLYARISREAESHGVGPGAWLCIAAGATLTLNCPAALPLLHAQIAPPDAGVEAQVRAAELIREVGLKCISFNGIPRTINALNAFRAALPGNVTSALSTTPSRHITHSNVSAIEARGRALWDSIYNPFEVKLLGKLAAAHPDLPVHILDSHYGPLLADPPGEMDLGRVGRIGTSLIAIACLRAQAGVGPQVLSHVFGLRKGVEELAGQKKEHEGVETDGELGMGDIQWLRGDEGCEWVLDVVDRVTGVIGREGGEAGAAKAKL